MTYSCTNMKSLYRSRQTYIRHHENVTTKLVQYFFRCLYGCERVVSETKIVFGENNVGSEGVSPLNFIKLSILYTKYLIDILWKDSFAIKLSDERKKKKLYQHKTKQSSF